MRVKYAYLDQQFSDVEPYIEDLRELVMSGEFTLGPYVERFEQAFAQYVGAKHIISTNTGTDALILGLKALGVSPGDEVITVPNSFYASAGAIAALGARPVFVDVDDRYQMDPALLDEAMTSRTRAILPVHWTGASPDMERILAIARTRGIGVIEDACPAVGARIGSRFAGTFGKVGAFSMHPLKPLNVWGDGGMIATDDDETAAYLRCYRNHGMTDRDHIAMWGVNARLQPVQAVVALRQLREVEAIVRKRNSNAQILDAGLSALSPFVKIPPRLANAREAFQLYVIRCQRRDALCRFLVDNNIEAKVHYPIPLHLQPPGRDLGYVAGDFPVAEKQATEILTLPSHQHLEPEHLDFMIDMIARFYTTT